MESGKDKRSRSAFFENPAALFLANHSSFLGSLQAEKLRKGYGIVAGYV